MPHAISFVTLVFSAHLFLPAEVKSAPVELGRLLEDEATAQAVLGVNFWRWWARGFLDTI